MKLRKCINDLLMEGTDDWVPIGGVVAIARDIGGAITQEEIATTSLAMIREVVQLGLMEIGALTGKGGRFERWDSSTEESLERLEREWYVWRGTPSFEIFCWLQNTATGNERGRQLLEEREKSANRG